MRCANLYLAILFGLLGLSWVYKAWQQPVIRGHWHLIERRGDSPGVMEFRTLDIGEDGSIEVNAALGHRDWYGYLESPLRRMRFGGECLAANFVYRRVGNILYLHERKTAVNDNNGCAMSFEKCDRSSCDEAAEFAARFAVDMHLPTYSGTDILFDSPLTTGVEVIARKKANSPAGVELIPTYGAGIAGDDGWCFAFETTRVKLPENMRDRVAPVVYADEKFSDNRLQIALHDRAKQFGFDHFYRAVIVVLADGTRKLTFHRLVVEPYPWRSCVIYG